MDTTCLKYLRSVACNHCGLQNVDVVVPPLKQAESCIVKFLHAQKGNPALCQYFVVGRKAWKSKCLYALRMQGRLHEVLDARKDGSVTVDGRTCVFPYSFTLCVALPKPTVTMGSVHAESPLLMTFPAQIRGKTVQVLFDSGASHSFIGKSCLQRLGMRYKPESVPLSLADGTESLTQGKVDLSFSLLPSVTSRHTFLVSSAILEGVDLILGQDWMEARGASIDFGLKAAQFTHKGRLITLNQAQSPMSGGGTRFVWGLRVNEKAVEGQVKDRNGRKQWKGTKDLWKVCLYTVMVGEQDEIIDITGDSTSEDELPELVSIGDELPVFDKEPPPPMDAKPIGGAESFAEQVDRITEGKPLCLKELLLANEDLFAKKLPGLPPERQVFHTINLEPGHRPPNRPAYRLARSELEECEKTVDELLALGLARPSCSPYASPVLFVTKKDGSLRMVIDYRPLNKITIPDRYPIPRIDDLLDRLKGAQVFSGLDLLSGYHQVRLKEEDVPKTAFRTPFGLYEFLVLPFGLTNAPATFQRLMNEVFHDFIREGFVVVYLDDVLVFSNTEEEHLAHLERVFKRLREHSLLAKLVKCDFWKKQLRYLGHIIGANGLQVDPDKVKVVAEWPTPTSVTEVRSFLGLANYFRKFVQGYSMIAVPLTKLTGSKATWKWEQEEQTAFETLKEKLVQAPVLTLPDVQKPFQVVCDACDYGIGAVLLQDGQVVAYLSKKLNDAERNYSTTEKELLAVVTALLEWRCYLLGKPVRVITDHRCNTFLSQQTGLSPRRARWAERVSEFDIEWVWEPGKTNIADPLSRAPALSHPQEGGGAAAARVGAAQLRKRPLSQPSTTSRGETPSKRPRQSHRQETDTSSECPAMDGGRVANRSTITPDHDGYETLLVKLKNAYAHDPWLAARANRRKVSLKDGFWMKENRKYVPAVSEEMENGEPVLLNLRKHILQSLHDPPHVGHPGVTRMYELVTAAWDPSRSWKWGQHPIPSAWSLRTAWGMTTTPLSSTSVVSTFMRQRQKRPSRHPHRLLTW